MTLKEHIALAIFNAELSRNATGTTANYKTLWKDCLKHADGCLKKGYLQINLEDGTCKHIQK